MGYYTRFEVTIDKPLRDELGDDDLDNALRDASGGYGFAGGETTDSCKWYEHETNMRDLSKKYPGVLFTVRGEGEESGDIWTKYFRDGKMQYCKAQIVVAPFDPAKLA